MTETAGAMLRRLREGSRLSLEELAADLGVTEGAVWQWEAGRTTPRRAMALKVDERIGASGALAAAFGYAPAGGVNPSVEWAPLELVHDLALKVEDLTRLVGEMGAEMERLRRERDR